MIAHKHHPLSSEDDPGTYGDAGMLRVTAVHDIECPLESTGSAIGPPTYRWHRVARRTAT